MALTDKMPGRGGLSGWFMRRMAQTGFQRRVARTPLLNRIARRDGVELFDIVQGFVASQVLAALVELDLFQRLLAAPMHAGAVALEHGLDPRRVGALMQAGAALGLLRRRRDGRYGLARKGAAILGVPGLEDMIRHNRCFYRDMSDPLTLLRGEAGAEVAGFWPYVFGAAGEVAPEDAARYSDLMARSQALVAEDTLRLVDLSGVRQLMDVGGGAGVFLSAALDRHQGLRGVVFDLPGVAQTARAELARRGLDARAAFHPGSFRDGPLPAGADAISLIRVLYDHDDATVRDLLRKAHDALPPGGRLILSEPMSGGARPDRHADVYFAFYTMALGTGQVRSAPEIAALCREAGFAETRIPPAPRPFITSVVEASRSPA